VYKQILTNAKLQIGKRGQNTELTGRIPLTRQRSALDNSTDEEEDSTDLYLFKFRVCKSVHHRTFK
jgi:hypothetical protein